jgi:hypothetical protein
MPLPQLAGVHSVYLKVYATFIKISLEDALWIKETEK